MTNNNFVSAEYEAPLDLLTARVVLITGAGNGIGRALAIAAAGHGASVVLLDRDVKQLEAVYDEIENNGGPQPAIYPLNLEAATPNDYHDLVGSLEQTFGRLDALVHNAANLGRPAPLDHYDVEAWYRAMQTNLNAPFLLTRAALPLLKRSPAASLVFVSDSVGRQGKAYWGAYGASKAGLEGLMQTLAAELTDSKIRVNSIDPGPVRTKLRRDAYPAENADALPPPEAVVPALLYLLGDDSATLHGRALSVAPRLAAAGTRVS